MERMDDSRVEMNVADWALGLLGPWASRMKIGVEFSGEEIHRFRVESKRLRAAWKMVELCVGSKKAKCAAFELGLLAKRFGGVRDLDVQRQLVAALVGEGDGALTGGFLDWFDQHLERSFCGSLVDKKVDEGCELLIQRASDHWMSCRESLSDASLLEVAVEKTFDKFCERGGKALKRDVVKRWHRCRRWVKYLYFQNQILAEIGKRKMPVSAKKLRRLGSELGKRNDLANLMESIDTALGGERFVPELKHLKRLALSADAELQKSTEKATREIMGR